MSGDNTRPRAWIVAPLGWRHQVEPGNRCHLVIGDVDADDVNAIRDVLRVPAAPDLHAMDIDGDGDVDFADLGFVAATAGVTP